MTVLFKAFRGVVRVLRMLRKVDNCLKKKKINDELSREWSMLMTIKLIHGMFDFSEDIGSIDGYEWVQEWFCILKRNQVVRSVMQGTSALHIHGLKSMIRKRQPLWLRV